MESDLHGVAHLAWLAVWNRSLASKGKSKQREEHEVDHQEDDDDEDDASGLLCTCAGMANDDGDLLEPGLMARRIGLAQGLLDFTRSFAKSNANGTSTSSEQEVRVVQSANLKLVFLQPEEGYWIAAAFQPAKRHPVNHSRDSSSASTIASPTSGRPGVNVHTSEVTSKIRQHGNQSYVDLSQSAYNEFKLFHGTLASNLDKHGRPALQDSLRTFFNIWSKRTLELTSLGIPKIHLNCSNEITGDDSNLRQASVVIHRRGVLNMPSTGDIPHTDALAIASHLFTLFPPLQSASSVRDGSHAHTYTKTREHRIRRQPSTASWKTLGLGHVGSYMRIPSIPGLSSAGSPTAPTTSVDANSPKDKSKSAEGPDWMSVSTFGMFGSKGKISAPSLPSNTPPLEAPQKVDNRASKRTSGATNAEEGTPLPASPVAENKFDTDSQDPQEDIAVHTVDDDLRHAIESELAVSVDSKAEKASDHDKVQILSQLKVYVGEETEPKNMVCMLLDDLAMAVLLDTSEDDTASLAIAKEYLITLSRNVSGRLRANPPDTTSHYYRTSTNEDSISLQDTAHSFTATEVTKQTSASSAMEAVSAFTRLGVQELFIRTNIAQWIAARFSQEGPQITLLPKSVGKEGSLLDAENELGRLHSQQAAAADQTHVGLLRDGNHNK